MFMDMNQMISMMKEAFLQHPVWQSMWMMAFWVSMYNFLFCKDSSFMYFTAIASLVWGMHFFTIWLISAAAVNMMDMLKNLLALKFNKSMKMSWMFMMIYLVMGYFTFDKDNIVSLVPTVTAMLSTFLVFYVSWIWLNMGFLFMMIMWMTYNYLGKSMGWVLTDSTLFFSGMMWMFSNFILKNNKS